MNQVSAFFRLIRYPNLLFIIITQISVYYFIIGAELRKAGELLSASNLDFALLVTGTVLIAAGGYVINDYFDVIADRINKPQRLIVTIHFSKRQTLHMHYAFNIIATLIGLYLGWRIGSFVIVSIFVLSAGLLWFYSSTFKHVVIIGNVVVSFLTAMVLLVVVLFERKIFTGEYTPIMAESVKDIFYISGGYAGFAFFASLVREMVKDMEDREGDDQVGSRTLAVVWGNHRVKIVVVGFMFIFIAAITGFIVMLGSMKGWLFLSYIITTLLLPALWLTYVILRADSAEHYHRASTLVKVLMLFGVLSIPYFYWIENL